MAQSFAATITNAKHVSMACAVINNGKPTGNTLFRMEGGRMSNQLQSPCCKQDPSSDKRLHCTKSSKKGVVADFISYKEAGRHLANTTSKHSHIKVYRQTMKGVCRYIQKGFYWRKEKRCLASITFTKHPFRQS